MKIVLHGPVVPSAVQVKNNTRSAGEAAKPEGGEWTTPFAPQQSDRRPAQQQISGRSSTVFRLQLDDAGPTHKEIDQFFEVFGLRNEWKSAIVDQLAKLDGELVGRFLERLSNIQKVEARAIIHSMAIDVLKQDGSFYDSPVYCVENVLSQKHTVVKPKWRTLGGMPPTEVPGLSARVSLMIESMLTDGFGYLSKTEPSVRKERLPELRDRFFSTFAQIDPELRGQLIDKLTTWPSYQFKWLVQEGALIDGSKDDAAEAIRSYESRWRKELQRDPELLRFLDEARWEPVGSHHNEKDFERPSLVSSASRILNRSISEWSSSHVDYALRILCETKRTEPEINQQLLKYAKGGHENSWQAVIGLAARGVKDVPWDVVVAASSHRFTQVRAFLELRDQHKEHGLQLPPDVYEQLKASFNASAKDIGRYAAGWIQYGQSETIAFVRYMGFNSPEVEAAITGTSGEVRGP